MGVISRGFKNAFRNGIRTTSIIFILAVSIGMALIMLISMKTVQNKIASVKSSVGNTITVSPAGVRGFEGGGTLLTDQNASDIAALPHVTKITETITDRMTTGTDTNLTSAIDAGSFGNRQRQRSQSADTNIGSNTSQRSSAPASFSMPIQITGTNDLETLSALQASQLDLASGQKIDPAANTNIAMVGTDLATKNSLSAGSTFTAYGQTVTVSGIFDAGNKFTNGGIIMPLKTAQNLSSQVSQINSMVVQADSIDWVASVQDSIKNKLGASNVDVTSQQDTSAEAIKPLENIRTISLYSLIGSTVAGAVIIFLTMLMIVRERRREIGVLKAIGSSNVGIMSMFTVEALVLTLSSSVVGIIAGLVLSNPILKVLLNNAESANNGTIINPNHGAVGARFAQAGTGVQNAINGLHAAVGWDILLYGLGVAVLIAIVGSAIPAFFIAKIRPAEVMRAE